MTGVQKTLDATSPASTATIDLDGPISCLSFCPQNENIMLVGTYELQESADEQCATDAPQIRRGRIYVVEITEQLICHVEETASGILDLRFSPTALDNFAVATSIGQVDVFKMDTKNLEVWKIRSFVVEAQSILILHLDWFQGLRPSDEIRIALALSDGRIAILKAQPQKYKVTFIRAHSLEAWYVAWDTLEPCSMYSGGDDSSFCVSSDPDEQASQFADDARESEFEDTRSQALYCNQKIHQAGVTSILPHPNEIDGDKIVLTGSYDETLRVLRQKNGRSNWEVKMEIPLGGGVWRLKFLTSTTNRDQLSEKTWSLTVLASCMHAGPKVVGIDFDGSMPNCATVVAEFDEHGSMNYASDARLNSILGWDIVSSSFYDQKLCLWHFSQPSILA